MTFLMDTSLCIKSISFVGFSILLQPLLNCTCFISKLVALEACYDRKLLWLFRKTPSKIQVTISLSFVLEKYEFKNIVIVRPVSSKIWPLFCRKPVPTFLSYVPKFSSLLLNILRNAMDIKTFALVSSLGRKLNFQKQFPVFDKLRTKEQLDPCEANKAISRRANGFPRPLKCS